MELNLCSPSTPSWHGQGQLYFHIDLPSGFCFTCFPMKNYVFLFAYACCMPVYLVLSFDDRNNMKRVVQRVTLLIVVIILLS